MLRAPGGKRTRQYFYGDNRRAVQQQLMAALRDQQQGLPVAGDRQQVYRLRNQVERLINRLKQFRRVATRYEKLVANYQAMVTLAASLLWL